MDIPGFGEIDLPSGQRSVALEWLAERTVADTRFALSVVHTIWRGLMRDEPLANPGEGADETARLAFQAQRDLFDRVATAFIADDHNLRTVVRELILSDAFRARGAGDDVPAWALLTAGPARLLTPEELSRKIEAVMGYPWRNRPQDVDYLLDRYRMLYGGIDSDAVVERLQTKSGARIIITASGPRCRKAFTTPRGQRRATTSELRVILGSVIVAAHR